MFCKNLVDYCYIYTKCRTIYQPTSLVERPNVGQTSLLTKECEQCRRRLHLGQWFAYSLSIIFLHSHYKNHKIGFCK